MRFLAKNLIIMILFAAPVCAQQKLNLESLIPPPPNSAELGKYGAFPVGYLTGIPDIKFPLYEVRSGKLQLPVILSYHASGIQVNQKATDVGLGWSIMAGGTITRTVYGAPDDGTYGYFNYTPPSMQTLYGINNFYTMQLYSNPGYDLEPDLFMYNLGGKSGKFIYSKADTFMTIPFDPIKIQKYVTDRALFRIVDDNGNIYTFDQTSNTISDMSVQRNTISSWYLTSIVSADYTDTIRFEYITNILQDPIRQEVFPIGKGKSGSSSPGGLPSLVYGPTEVINGTSLYNELLLRKIIFRNGYVQFNRNTLRKDVDNIPSSCYALDEMVVYNAENQLTKKIVFHHDYFLSPSFMDRWDFYRLRLTGFTETGIDTTLKKVHTFGYDATPLPHYHSFSMDYWGFYNGAGNSTLIPATTVNASDINSVSFANGLSYGNAFLNPAESWTIGGANRAPSAIHMQAGILNKVTYPAGGHTIFEYEPHQYMSEEYVQQLVSKSNVTHGINKFTLSTSTQNFSYPQNAGNASVNPPHIYATLTINFSASNMGNTEMGETQRVIFTDLTTNSSQIWTHTGDLTVPLTLEPVVMLVNGRSYSIKHEIYGQYEVTISTYLNWNENQNQQVQKIGGGLRIKSIKNYTGDAAAVASEQTFKYGANEDGLGVKMFNEENFYRNYEDVVYAYFNPSQVYCLNDVTSWQRKFLGISKYNPLTYMGSPIVYSSVVHYDGSLLNNKGKTVYAYNIIEDPDDAPDEFINSGNYGSINKAWNQGELMEETTYRNASGQFIPVTQTRYEYEKYNLRQESAIQIKQYKQFVKLGDCATDPTGPEPSVSLPGQGYFSFYNYMIKTGSVKKTKETKVVFNSSSPLDSVVTVTNYKYQNPWHLYLTELSVLNSKGEGKISRMKYPQDVTGTVPAAMATKNMLTPVLEQREYKSSGASEILLTTTLTGYKQSGSQINRDTIKSSTGNNVPEPRIEFKLYNAQGNILEQKMTDNVVQSYIWDYKGEYPVAEVVNTFSGQIAYTSFESDGTGNWTVGSTARVIGGITGKKYYSLANGNVSKSGLAANQVYTVSYWTTNSSALTIAGTQGSPVKGRTARGWTYYEHKISNVTQVVIPQTSVAIDELRLYPETARMTTYTYDMGIGVTTVADPNNAISYYLYDALNRLIMIKDIDNNILKTIDYKYQATSGQ